MNSTLEQILKQSAHLIAQRGYHGTSMRDLSNVTGRSLSGLYHYFGSKEELLYLINEQGFSSLDQRAEQLSSDRMSPEELLHTLIVNHVTYFSEHLSEMRVMMFGTQQMSAERGREIRHVKQQYADRIESAVADYCNQHLDQPIDDTSLARKTYLLFGMMNWIFGWYSRSEHGLPTQLAEDIYLTFTRGVCSLPEERR